MNELLKDGLMILSGLIGGYLFVLIRKKVVNQTKQVVEEKFNLPKFTTGMLNITSPVGWAKDIASIFSLRKLIIIGIIIGCIWGYGWYVGTQGKPVHFDMRGKEAIIQLNEHFLRIDKDGTANVIDKDGKILKVIKVKDIPSLRKALRPYGLDMRAFVTAGGSLGQSGAKAEAGIGMQWFKWYQWYLNSFLTNVGIYPVGVSYKITDNFDIIAGAGIGYKEFDKRVYIGGKWRF